MPLPIPWSLRSNRTQHNNVAASARRITFLRYFPLRTIGHSCMLFVQAFTSAKEDQRMPSLNPPFLSVICISCVVTAALAQSNSSRMAAKADSVELDHFDVKMVDSSLDPCVDFYQYTCKKWIAGNPIPPDQPAWGPDGKMQLWNQDVLRESLEKASSNDAGRSVVEQKIGDYYASCMDQAAIDAKGAAALKPELDRIDALTSKSQLPAEIAHLHQITFSLAQNTNSGFETALFGLSSGQDFDDASKVVSTVDQGGLGLPDRDYYLKDDPKSAETRAQYVAHVQKTFALLGEDSATASADAKIVM